MTVEDAQKILKNFTCLEIQSAELQPEKIALREAVALVASQSDYQMLGVCAASVAEGLSALETYTKALGYHLPLDREAVAPVAGPVYIKFNGRKGSYYVETYTGTYRGVLVSCQSTQEAGINETYGHFPLDLFVD